MYSNALLYAAERSGEDLWLSLACYTEDLSGTLRVT
jgi:hypothetical protein